MNALFNFQLAWKAVAGRSLARVSLFVRIIGVAFATLVLLIATTASGALDERGDRTTWRSNAFLSSEEFEQIVRDGPWLEVAGGTDFYLGHEIERVLVAKHSDLAEVPPGLQRFPLPGEVFVSPELAELIDADPAVLGTRYGDTIAGTISNDGLGHPGELLAITGIEVVPGHPYFGHIYQELPKGFDDTGISELWVVITIGVVVMLFPIAMFIAAAARLNAQESDARLAALRLAGAEPSRVRWIVAWESLLSAVPGALLGLGLVYAVRPLVAPVELNGSAFFASDFALNSVSLLVLLVVPMLVVAASFIGLRDVEISPLGVSRKSARKQVRPIGFLFLVPGFALLWWVLGMDGYNNVEVQAAGVVGSILLILVGLALIGTWLGQFAARIGADRVSAGSVLLAFRRIVSDPHASFRSVSGVTFAVFAGTLFLSLSAALEREVEVRDSSGFGPDALWVYRDGSEHSALQELPAGASAVLVKEVFGLIDHGTDNERFIRVFEGDCDAVATVLRQDSGRCGGQFAVSRYALQNGLVRPGDTLTLGGAEPPFSLSVPDDVHVFDGEIGMNFVLVPPGTVPAIDTLTSGTIVVMPGPGVSPGSSEFEQLRTFLMRAYPAAWVNSARAYDAGAVRELETMRDLVYAGTFAAFLFSGGTAAMAVAGSIIARRQSFALLRMSGVSIGSLRKTVMAEATLPLALVSMVSVATAVSVSAIMIHRSGQGSVLPPAEFILPLIGGLIVGLALPLMTLPMLSRTTAMERTRFD